MRRTAEDILREKGFEIISVDASASLHEALQKMSEKNVGAVVVSRDDEPVGIWTERDLMRQLAGGDLDLKAHQVGSRMSGALITADADEQVYQLYDKFLGRRVRHLLVTRNEKIIGLLSVGDVVKASLQQKMQELEELNEIVSLEYYENWKIRQAERF